MQTAHTHTQIQPSELFVHSITANIDYWQQRTKALTAETLPKIDHDCQNLYRAVKFGLEIDATWRETAQLILQNYVLIERRGYWGEWIPILERALAGCGDDQLALRGRLLDHLGLFYQHNRQLEKAIATHREELEIGLTLQDKWRQGHACINLGAALRQMRRFVAAKEYVLQADAAFQAIAAPTIKHAFVALELGLLAQAQGEWTKAEEHLNYSVRLWREVGDPIYLANCLKLLGQVLVAQNKTAVAAVTYHEALDLLDQTENQLGKTRLLNELGVLYLKQKELNSAQHYLMAADKSIDHQSGNLYIQAVVATNIGKLYLAQGQLSAAENAFQRSINLWQMYADPVQYANALGSLAEVKTEQGDFVVALGYYQQALELLIDYQDDAWGRKLQAEFEAAKMILQSSRIESLVT